jgi:phage terminase small subunit
MKLTGKQEKFAQGIAKGLTQADAYREAYDCEDMAENTIHRQAHEVMKNGKVTARVEELKTAIQEELVYSAKQSFDKFNELQELAVVAGNIGAAISAEEKKGKLAGLYEDKVNLKGLEGIGEITFVVKDVEKS